MYEVVIGSGNYLEDERTIAAALSNLAQDYQIYGDFEKSRYLQNDAIAHYTKLNLPLNLSIAYCGLGLLETEMKNYDLAEQALKKSSEFAQSTNYIRGIYATKIYLADCASCKGDFKIADGLLKDGLKGFADLNLNEARNYEIKARWFCLQKRLSEAEGSLKEGFRACTKISL